ncbi:lysophospholipid acyltransferase family protein [Coprobacter fastidiosus]|uniref:lysophospholipid acyltransferase family protein n=1 Tax=Coprobacter fastidiosus TaxID=1099853 RepID=UPI001D408BBA|nr:lysophospholipid acyltransferase family protein [Coprobacter fastidiosus]HJF43651.1 lysophospholipid acyltransferase family protein [Coprobacter fastidiosus]
MKKETSENILYFPLYFYFWLHALLPLKILYILSDILFFPMFYIVRYRRKLVYQNMKDSFPEKSKKEIRRMEKAFYHHFCDYIVETIKLLHISDKETRKRVKFHNTEALQEIVDNGGSCLMLLGHYGNWEFVPSVTLWMRNGSVIFAQIYRPLKNKWFDRFFLKLRGRYHSECIAKQDTLRSILRYKSSGRPSITGFMADQTPSPANIHHWVNFLNHDTPVFTGVEKIAHKVGFSVFYFDVEKIKRGYYSVTIREISKNPKETEEFEITNKYMEMMETTILRAPEYWLWTHNRWKHKRS